MYRAGAAWIANDYVRDAGIDIPGVLALCQPSNAAYQVKEGGDSERGREGVDSGYHRPLSSLSLVCAHLVIIIMLISLWRRGMMVILLIPLELLLVRKSQRMRGMR